MRRWAVVVLAGIGLALIIGSLMYALPIQNRNWEYCNRQGGMYIAKSMICVTDHGMENLFGKNVDN